MSQVRYVGGNYPDLIPWYRHSHSVHLRPISVQRLSSASQSSFKDGPPLPLYPVFPVLFCTALIMDFVHVYRR